MAVKAADTPPPRAMVLNDADRAVRARASSSAATRRSPASACRGSSSASWPATDRQPFAHGSGRLDLARAITAPDNPLTGRVIVNRVWMHHFGEPLVSTPSDFGTRSSPPIASRAARLPGRPASSQGGWSLKALHRLIMLSSTYQQASLDRPDVPQGRPREPPALAVQPPPARLRGDARHAARSSRAGSTRRWAAGRWTSPTTPRPRGGRSTAWSTARACPPSSAPSTSPAPTSPPSAGPGRPCPSRPCSA